MTALNILLVGGTGFIGPHIVRALCAAGHRLTLFNRGRSGGGLFPNLPRLEGDRLAGELSALEGTRWDVVVDTCAYVPRVVQQLLETVETGRYVFVSTISVYAEPGRRGLTEEAAVAGPAPDSEEITGGSYGPLKAACEQVALERLGARVAVVRPGLIVGPGDATDRFPWWPARVARGGRFPAPGSGDDPLQIIDARDLADFVVRCVEDELSGIYNLTGPYPTLTVRDVVAACMAHAGPDAEPVWTPWETLKAHGVEPWRDLPAMLPADHEAAGFAHVNIDRARAAGLRFRPLAETVADTLRWVREERGERAWSAGLSAEREAALWEALDGAKG